MKIKTVLDIKVACCALREHTGTSNKDIKALKPDRCVLRGKRIENSGALRRYFHSSTISSYQGSQENPFQLTPPPQFVDAVTATSFPALHGSVLLIGEPNNGRFEVMRKWSAIRIMDCLQDVYTGIHQCMFMLYNLMQ